MPEVLNALRLGAYQLQFLNRVPARAAINESVELVKRAQKRSAAPFANAVLRKMPTASTSHLRKQSWRSASVLAHEFAHPEWLVERWVAEFGEERAWAICEFDQRIPAPRFVSTTRKSKHELRSEGIELAPGALLASARIVVGGDVTQTRAFREGRVFIQDEASQLVAALVGTGSRLLDCCAAPGGKTAALAARNPTAEIIAAELHPHRADLLRKRVRAANVQVINADALTLPLQGGFDRVLADVPCSGTGTLARNPEIKWRLKPEDLGDLHARQVGDSSRRAAAAGAGRPRGVFHLFAGARGERGGGRGSAARHNRIYKCATAARNWSGLRESGELVWDDMDSLLSGKFLRTIPGVHPCDGFFAAVMESSGQRQELPIHKCKRPARGRPLSRITRTTSWVRSRPSRPWPRGTSPRSWQES